MIFKKAAALLLTILPFSASADWVGGFDYKRFTDKNSGPNLHFDVLAGTIGYEFDVAKNFKLTPQLTYGVGFGDDSRTGWIGQNPETTATWYYELDNYYEASLRAQYQFTDKIYGFATVSRSRTTISTIAPTATNKNSRNEWGGSVGVGYQLSDNWSMELAYQSISSTDVISLGVRYRF